MDQLTYETTTDVGHAAAVAGTTDVKGSTFDMEGYDGIRAIAQMGALTASQITSLRLQGGAAANGSDSADIVDVNSVTIDSGAAADADSGKLLIVDLWHPQQRYITPVFKRGTANAVLDAVIVERYKARTQPTSTPATVSKQAAFRAG